MGAVGLAGLMSLLLARLLKGAVAAPIHKLQYVSRRYIEGDYQMQADISANDEIGELANSFNDLASSLSVAQTALKEQTQRYETVSERIGLLADFTNRIRQSLDVNSILSTSVDGVREVLKVDRVLIYRFSPDFKSGFISAESVGHGWTKALGQTIHDPLVPEALQRFRSGKISLVRNIETETLSHCHCEILQKLEVKANMVAPILVDDQLMGLLCVHQCATARNWDASDIELLQQLTAQVGYALTQTALLQQQQLFVARERQLNEIVSHMRETLDTEKIFRTVVRSTRDALKTDRTVVYLFDENWVGTVMAESVDSKFPAALGATIPDPCFAENYIEKYRQGRVVGTEDIYNAGLTECYLRQLEPFQVKANLVAPIVVEERLLGLLITHQCSATRAWKENEINFFQQIAVQLGFALEQANLFAQTVALSDEQRQQKEILQLSVMRERQFNEIVSRMRESLDTEKIYRTVVKGTREALKANRTVVYLFDEDWMGTVMAESVEGGFPAALGAAIPDPCFAERYIEKYRQGRVVATDDIHNAGLTECYLKQLEAFQVKANLVAPIVVEERLLGLLVAHQCSAPRAWKENEISFFQQIAIQLGFALEQANLFAQTVALSDEQRQQKEALQRSVMRERQLNEIVSRMRESLDLEKIFRTVVKEAREALKASRTIVYLFDERWAGTVVAESVESNFPTALGAMIADPCFAANYIEKYRQGRVVATNDIHNAGLTECHLKQLEPFQVKANLVAPIVVEERLLGLLISHQCAAPRDWKETEISFFQQIAVQLGFALEQANLFVQTKALSEEQRQQKRRCNCR
ncbi:MAG: GAF domain-containing protein [Leptolyngbyaceae cyanobacterium SL_7_1]|nr:GAF domain-containing protein [Leptolyngbyaceae cyanobacterium SL_7_1]